jgi:SNF2 family DNA or RNA helicase
MSLPRIRKDFRSIGRATPKAIEFIDFDGKAYWVPRSICTLVKEKKDMIVVTLAAFKFEEITGVQVEPLTTTFSSLGGEVLPHHRTCCAIIGSDTTRYKPGQLRCIEAAIKSRYMALLCEAGTGKTFMSCVVAYSRWRAGLVDNIVVLCPASLRKQWMELSRSYYPDMNIDVYSIHSASYTESLERMKTQFNKKKGSIQLIVDEVHLCRNQSAKRSRNIEKSFHADYCMILTGFPIERNAGDLFYQFGIMGREIIGCENYGQFQKSFLLLGGDDGEQVVAYQNTTELAARINPYIVRLAKREVAPGLPGKHYHEIFFDMGANQLKAYQAINGLIASYGFMPKNKQYQLGTFSQKLASGYTPTDEEIAAIFGNLGKLGEGADNVARIGSISFDSNNNRMQALINLLSGKPYQFLIWCNFTDEIHAIAEILPRSGVINGEIDMNQRDKVINEFKRGELQYLIISIAINEGFNLQCCCNEVFYSDNYSRTKAENAADRCHRIGQDKTVNIYKLIARGSLDERIKKVRERKTKICNIFNNDQDFN